MESALHIFDDRDGTAKCIYQCGSCKAENTFDAQGPGDLFKQPNYDFIPVLCGDEILIFRRGAYRDAAHDMGYTAFETRNPSFGSFTHSVVTTEDVALLDSFETIVQATRRHLPIVGKTLIENPETQLRAEIEYPVKTLNLLFDPDIYQVDTGPVLFPDLSQRYDTWAEAMSLAYIAYETRTRDFADFVVEAPVPVLKDGEEVCRVMHYSQTLTCKAVNSLWSIGVTE